MTDIHMNELGPKMTAELWTEVAKQVSVTDAVGTPLAYIDAVERDAFRAAVAAVVTWARIRTLRAAVEKTTA